MTGRYPARTPIGLMEPLRGAHKDSIIGLTPEYPSIATLLHKSGYETYLVGKWHLGYGPQYGPNKMALIIFWFQCGRHRLYSHTNRKGEPDLYENERSVTKEGYLTDIWMDKSVEIIKQKHSKPFFLSVMFNAPHWPIQAPGDKPYPRGNGLEYRGNQRKYAAMVKSMDEAIGKIMQTIEDEKYCQQYHCYFTSDNGGEAFADMGPYTGGKNSYGKVVFVNRHL